MSREGDGACGGGFNPGFKRACGLYSSNGKTHASHMERELYTLTHMGYATLSPLNGCSYAFAFAFKEA